MPSFKLRFPLSKPRKSVPEPFEYEKSLKAEVVFQLPHTDKEKLFSAGISLVLTMIKPPE